VIIGTGLIIRARDIPPVGFYRPGALYAVWDTRNRIIGEYISHHAGYDLPEFNPLIWEGQDAEPLRHICAGPMARIQPVRMTSPQRTTAGEIVLYQE